MDQLEKVESLREKTGCSYSEAKAALEESGDDLLEALCWLEQHGKTGLSEVSGTSEKKAKAEKEPKAPKEPREPGAFIRGLQSLWEGLAKLINSSLETALVMTDKQGKQVFSMPLLVAILVMCMVFWPMVVLILVALFFGNRFSLVGTLARDPVNDALGKATEFAESVKDGIFQEKEENKDNDQQ